MNYKLEHNEQLCIFISDSLFIMNYVNTGKQDHFNAEYGK